MNTTSNQVLSGSLSDAAQRIFTDRLILLGLVAAVFLVYVQVGLSDFVNYDDGTQVYQNPQVVAGLTGESIKWAFTSVVIGRWMPLTLLSHQFDVQLFGLRA